MAHIPISEWAAREFGRLVSRLIELRGPDYTQKDLADGIRRSPQLVSQIVQGHVPSPEILRDMASELRVSYFELWMAAYGDLIPPGYELVPRHTNGAEDAPLSVLLQNPTAVRLLRGMASMEPDRLRGAVHAWEEIFGVP